ncbi:MAG TPA: hypothetical protein PKK59_03120 [Anaerolineaceae bacterium]|nr:hypothetical protein [Anaerolineaceae bacterium]
MSKRLFICFTSIVILMFAAGCDVKSADKDIAQILYTIDSGSVLPELQAHEVYTITPGTVQLTRTGKNSNTQVFEGEWTFTTAEGLLKELFTIAESQDCSTYKRVEPGESPDGGDTITVALIYSDESECVLTYNPGVTYNGAEELMTKIREVLDNLKTMPAVIAE